MAVPRTRVPVPSLVRPVAPVMSELMVAVTLVPTVMLPVVMVRSPPVRV